MRAGSGAIVFPNFAAKKKKAFLYKIWQKAMESELQMLFSVGTRRPLVASPEEVTPPQKKKTNQTDTTDT